MMARLSPTWPMYSLFPGMSWYATVQVVPLIPESNVWSSVLSVNTFCVARKDWRRASSTPPCLSSRKPLTTCARAKSETSCPFGPCPSNTEYNAKSPSTTTIEKLSWFGDSGFIPLWHLNAKLMLSTQARHVGSSLSTEFHTYSSSLVPKDCFLFISRSVFEKIATAFCPRSAASWKSCTRPNSASLSVSASPRSAPAGMPPPGPLNRRL
mmetsp:Transcript_11649/g.41595  ORF Transcript_11649/g.41595 Transcript_11649/m.41595 type:complete len:210 (-) Transcript_11649:127-756(-)